MLPEQRAVVLHALGNRVDKVLQMADKLPIKMAGIERGQPLR